MSSGRLGHNRRGDAWGLRCRGRTLDVPEWSRRKDLRLRSFLYDRQRIIFFRRRNFGPNFLAFFHEIEEYSASCGLKGRASGPLRSLSVMADDPYDTRGRPARKKFVAHPDFAAFHRAVFSLTVQKRMSAEFHGFVRCDIEVGKRGEERVVFTAGGVLPLGNRGHGE